MEEYNYLGFFVGLGAGLLGFLLQDRVAHIMAGRRFRQRVACDIEIITRNHMNHLPVLKKRINDLQRFLDRREVPGDIESYRVIWANEFSLLPHLLENSAHLRLPVFNACIEFYDIMGRLEEIRRAHNDSARHLATSAEDRSEHFQFLHYCLKEQMLEYVYVIEKGGAALRSLASSYRHVDVDDELLASIFQPA